MKLAVYHGHSQIIDHFFFAFIDGKTCACFIILVIIFLLLFSMLDPQDIAILNWILCKNSI